MTEHGYTPHPETLADLQRGAAQIRVVLDPQPSKSNMRFQRLFGGKAVFGNAESADHLPLPYAKGDVLTLKRVPWTEGWLDPDPSYRVTDFRVERVQEISAWVAVYELEKLT